MRTGFVPVTDGQGGGIYQYSQTMLHTMLEWGKRSDRYDLILFTPERAAPGARHGRHRLPLHEMVPRQPESKAIRFLKGLPGARLANGVVGRARRIMETVQRGDPSGGFDPGAVQYRPEVRRHLRQSGVSMMVYPMPHQLSFEAGIPYMMSVHDLQHRLQPHFPEVSANGEWEHREYLFRNGIRNASMILVDSEVGREDVLDVYADQGIDPDRIRVLPFLPALYLSVDVPESERDLVRGKYGLPDEYLFYPAQFWPHKNHLGIVRALSILKNERGLTPPILFCGAATGPIRERNLAEVVATARQLGVEHQIHFVGYVPDSEMSALYAGASALVMPTFFGPTNIPVLEAWAYGCPVLTSDIRGVREQAGDAAILADPSSPESIAGGIERIIGDGGLRSELAARGRGRLARYTPQDYSRRLREAFDDAVGIVRIRKQILTLYLLGLFSLAF
jgi:glycosyltransferase involved in cell wall biosynthesis